MAKKQTKSDKVIAYVKKHPDATIAEVAEACNVSAPTVSAAKKKAGLTSGRRGRSVSQSSMPSAKQLESLAEAVKLAGGHAKLGKILDHVQNAGGIDAVAESLSTYEQLKEIFK